MTTGKTRALTRQTFVGKVMSLLFNMLSRLVIPLFPGGSEGKASACNAGNLGSIPGSEDLLEKEIATHSSILAWKIPWMENPGRLRSMGSQRVDMIEQL